MNKLNLETQKAMESIGFMVIRGKAGKPIEHPFYFAYLQNSKGQRIGSIEIQNYYDNDLELSAFTDFGYPIIGYKHYADRPATAKIILNQVKKLGLEIEKAY